MAKLPDVTSKEVVKVLEKFGFIETRMKGAHKVLKRENIIVVVPIHNKSVGKGLLKSILRQANLTVEEFINEL